MFILMFSNLPVWNTIYLNRGNTSKLEIIQVPVQNFSSEFPFHYQLLAASTLDQEQCRDKIGAVPQLWTDWQTDRETWACNGLLFTVYCLLFYPPEG